MRLWTPQPKAEQGTVMDPSALWPKFSARVPDDLHQRIRIEGIRRHMTVQAILIAALEAWLSSTPSG